MIDTARSFHEMHTLFRERGIRGLDDMVAASEAFDTEENRERFRFLFEYDPDFATLPPQEKNERLSEAPTLLQETTFHKDVANYRAAGIKDEWDMTWMSKRGVSSHDAAAYAELGFTDNVTMLGLSAGNVSGRDAEKLSTWGFTTPEAMIKVRSIDGSYLHDACSISGIERYVMAGFGGDPDAIIELAARDRYGKTRITADYALFLAEHGLEGDKDAMLAVPKAISYETLRTFARRIANQLAGEPVDSEEAAFKQGEQVRRAHASEIPVHHLIVLTQYDWGENDIQRDHPLSVAYRAAYAKDGKKTAEVKEAYAQLSEGRGEIKALQDQRLMEVFQELKTGGIDAFRKTYSLREGWVENGQNGLRYDPRAARQRAISEVTEQ